MRGTATEVGACVAAAEHPAVRPVDIEPCALRIRRSSARHLTRSWGGAGATHVRCRYGDAARSASDPIPPSVPPPPRSPHDLASSHPKRRRLSAEDTLALWKRVPRAPATAPLRDRLVMTFAPLVKYIVYKKVREMPARCEVEDFISCGLEALIHSIERYDPEKGATLEQYAWTRIHGAVLDELRRQDWAPRSVRRWERDIERAAERVHRPARPPSLRRTSWPSAMATTVDELRKRRDEITQSDLTSLNTLVLSDDETTIERIDTHRLPGRRGSTRCTPPPRSEAKDKFRARLRPPAPARARGRRPALRQEHDAGRDRRDPRRLRVAASARSTAQLKQTLRDQLDDDAPLFQAVA